MGRARISLDMFVSAIIIIASSFDRFFFIFVVPGVTLVAVAWWPTTASVPRLA